MLLRSHSPEGPGSRHWWGIKGQNARSIGKVITSGCKVMADQCMEVYKEHTCKPTIEAFSIPGLHSYSSTNMGRIQSNKRLECTPMMLAVSLD